MFDKLAPQQKLEIALYMAIVKNAPKDMSDVEQDKWADSIVEQALNSKKFQSAIREMAECDLSEWPA